MLKLKVKIFQYTGLYLATREELKHLTSKETIREIEKQFQDPDNDFTLEELIDIEIGTWQLQHGFGTPYIPGINHIKLIDRIKERLYIIIYRLKDDLGV